MSMSSGWFLIFQVFLLTFGIVNCGYKKCSSGQTCSQCITLNANCGWCSADNYPGPRCSTITDLYKSGCSNGSIEFPVNKVEVKRNEELSPIKVASEHEAIQVKPQYIKLNLRPNMVETINLYYRQAVDYPVDLYYLMDLSRTMRDHKRTLAALGNELAKQMKLITKNFRLGFGSFIDKDIQPFTDTHSSKIAKPCDECPSSPYAFKNSMSLGIDTEKFIKMVEESPLSGNIDKPEGGFDAIMQAMVCQHEIGWRRDARHLLVVTTDSGFHYAGDGRLAGLIKPNDEQCHLNSSGYYSEARNQDYPSINQINMVSQEKNVHIIFSVTDMSLFEPLVKKIASSSLAQLSSNSSNIVDIIKGEYKQITSSVQLVDNASDHFLLTYYSTCSSSDDNFKFKKTSFCNKVNSTVNFKVKIELIKCPEKVSHRREFIKIHPNGLEDGLIVEVNMICDCNCEDPSQQIKSANQCNGKGTYSCGICNCNQGSFGSRCECDADDYRLVDDVKCYSSPNDTKPCLGRGKCVCGQCSCFPAIGHLYSGDYCQCDDLSCNYYQGQLCGGPNRGTCKCGQCFCSDLYTGSDCSCPRSPSNCIDPTSDLTCNDRGTCVCGQCLCNSTQYKGPYCDECPTCQGQCPLYYHLVESQIINGTKELRKINKSNQIVSTLVTNLIMDPGDKMCQFIQDNCAYNFSYRSDGLKLSSQLDQTTNYSRNQLVIIKALRNRVCTQPINLSAYVVEYIGSIIIIGLITLLVWRLITFMLDRHEYQKFLKACAAIEFPENQNPLFKPSTSKFTNPAYNES